jgi:hypothetical protein
MFAASKTDSVSDGGYQISRSLRFNSADSAYLDRTPATTTNRTTWTWSGWVKRASFGSSQVLFGAGPDGSNYTIFYFSGTVTDNLEIFNYTGSVTTGYVYTAAVFRDPSAWYHVVLAIDTTQATSADRTKIYVNGVLQPITISTTFASSLNTWVNTNNGHRIGSTPTTGALNNGYITEINFIDGQALTPSSFGETNAQTGVWQPKPFVGTYGTNGFYVNFSDNSNTTAATLGADYSGNGNNWTPNNFSVSAGAGNDSMVDVPTPYGVDTGAGGSVRGNYATLNALNNVITLSNGNLNYSNSPSSNKSSYSTIGVSSGKWYAEAVWTLTGGTAIIGVALQGYDNISTFVGGTLYAYGYEFTGFKYNNGSNAVYGSTWVNGDAIGVALDLDAGTVTFYKNGVSQGVAYSGLQTGTYFIGVGLYGSTGDINFGQRPFAYTAPSGFKAICTQNLPTPTVGATTATQAGKFFNTVLWTGSGTQTRSITGLDFQPDLTWMKIRADTPQDHQLYDAVRGAGGGKNLSSNTTAVEGTVNGFPDSDYGYLSSFDSVGFSVNDGAIATTGGYVNYSGRTYVAWNWKANGAGSSNTSGSITSTVSANTTNGFSIVTYTGNSTSGATVGHGLGVTPSMVIVKGRNAAGLAWCVYVSSLGASQYLFLNDTAAAGSYSGFWNNTSPTSTLLTLGNDDGTNGTSKTYVAYCFAPVAGYSAFGSYTGNGSADGPFVYTGFKPAFILYKRTSSAGNSWRITDSTRSTYNLDDTAFLYPDSTQTENNNANDGLDILSNGFKMRTSNDPSNNSGSTYIYMAFASSPFKYSLAR